MHQDRALVLHGQRFHYTEWGPPAAAPVLLLHGVTDHARSWDPLAASLAGRYRVLALDQRGHGDSDPAPDGDYSVVTIAEDVAAFADALGLPALRVVGLSLGGRVAIAWAAARPAGVARLVVVDIGPDISEAGLRRVATVMAATPERFASVDEAYAYVRGANARYDEAMLRHRIAHAVRPLPDGGYGWKYDRAIRDAVRAGRRPEPVDLWALWRALTVPVLLVRGAESDVLSAETAKRMIETQADARLVEVPDAGHTVPGDRPDVFNALVARFFDEP